MNCWFISSTLKCPQVHFNHSEIWGGLKQTKPMPERRSKLFDFFGIRSSKFGASSNQKAPLRGPSLKSNKGLSSLRSDIPKGEVRAFKAHAGTSFLAFFIFGIRSGKPGSSPNKKCPRWGHGLGMRRERDSNPRTCYSQRFSRPPQSTTLPSLRRKCTPKSGFGAHKPSRGPPGAKGRDPELIECRLYRRGVLGHRVSSQVKEA